MSRRKNSHEKSQESKKELRFMFMARVCSIAAMLFLNACCGTLCTSVRAAPPGAVIAHSPAKSGIYIGSAGIVRLADGTYLAKHDEFGPGSTEHTSAVTRVYRSADRGRSWAEIAKVDGLFWASIFDRCGAVYMIGTHHHHGALVCLRSDDGGTRWTTPRDGQSGLLREGKWHTAPMPIISHGGRLWRAVEDADGPEGWGQMYRPRVMSIAEDGDLLDAAAWTITNPIERDGGWLGGDFWCVLEGNAVVDRNGIVRNVLRSRRESLAAVTTVSADGRVQRIDPEFDRAAIRGASKKMLIRWDERSKLYWALANPTPKGISDLEATKTRNVLAAYTSPDLRKWTRRATLLSHADAEHHAFQYPDWTVDGDDMLIASRTAFDDDEGGAHRAHDANYLTFHRVEEFRALAADGQKDWLSSCAIAISGCDEARTLVVQGDSGLHVQRRSISEPIHMEVAVEREDRSGGNFLGDSDESRIGQIHWTVAILVHQLGSALQVGRRELFKQQPFVEEQSP